MRIRLMWRFAAVIGIGLYIAMIGYVVWFLVSSPLFLVALALSGLMLVYGSWLAFSGADARRHRGMVLLGMGAVVAVISTVHFLYDTDAWGMAAGLLLLGLAYVALVGLMRNTYWAQKRSFGMTVAVTGFKRPYLIINPRSGNGRAIKAHIDPLARRQGIRTIILDGQTDVSGAAKRAVDDGADVLGISGGDGSIGAVAAVAIEQDLPLVVLPGGTRCHFARDLGLEPKRIADTLEAFHGVPRKVDVGSINGRIFLNNASFGLYAEAVGKSGYRENKRAVFRQLIQEISEGTKPPYDLRFEHDGRKFTRAVQVVAAVDAYATYNLIEPGRRDRLDAGVLQVSVINELNDMLVAALFKRMFFGTGKLRQDMAGFIQWLAPSFTLSSGERNILVGVDGENEVYETPVHVRIHPGVLRLYVPAEGVRPRRYKVFSPKIVRHMWRTIWEGDPV